MNQKLSVVMGLAALLGLQSLNVHAMDTEKVPEIKRTTLGLYLDAKEANEFIKSHANTLFVDIRTRAEVNYLGMATDADANVPYVEMNNFWQWDEKKNSFKLDPNGSFVEQIEKRLKEKNLGKDANIIVMCRSGDRSAKATNLLANNGYKHVYTVVDGYEGDIAKDGPNKGKRAVNGWRNAGLPWSYDLAKAKMTLE